MRFQKFNLQEPGTVDEGDADDSDDDDNDQQDDATISGFMDMSYIASSRSTRSGGTGQDGLLLGDPAEESLLDAKKPHEKVDAVAGVTPKLYADIAKDDTEQKKVVNNFMGCEDFAVIAFWDLDSEDN